MKAMDRQQYDDSMRDQAAKLKAEGKNMKEISDLLDIPYHTVYGWLGKGAKPQKPGRNSDRHLCRTCQYRGGNGTVKNGCDYIEIVGHSRGCSVEECILSKRGKRIKRNTHSVRNGFGDYEE